MSVINLQYLVFYTIYIHICIRVYYNFVSVYLSGLQIPIEYRLLKMQLPSGVRNFNDTQ